MGVMNDELQNSSFPILGGFYDGGDDANELVGFFCKPGESIRWDDQSRFHAEVFYFNNILRFRPGRAETSSAGVEGPGLRISDQKRPERWIQLGWFEHRVGPPQRSGLKGHSMSAQGNEG